MSNGILANTSNYFFSVSIIIFSPLFLNALFAIILNVAIGPTVLILIKLADWFYFATGIAS